MTFKEFRDLIGEHFAEMSKDATQLFEVEVDKDEFWNLYLDSYPAGTNEVYRTRREYDCSCCRGFVKNFGNVVVIKNNKIHTIWDVLTNDPTFQLVANAMSQYLNDRAVSNIYVNNFANIGTHHNTEYVEETKTVIEYNHFFVSLPAKFVNKTSRSIGDLQGDARAIKDVFKRSLTEITKDSVLTVLELINSNTLYRGAEWKTVLMNFLDYKQKFMQLTSDKERDLFCWENASKAGVAVGKIRNHSIGTLLTNISEGMDLDKAVTQYEKIVAPANYKRPKAIFTQKMLDDAKKTLTDMGYMDSLRRRYAVLDDITINNILFANRDSAKRISGALDVFDEMSKSVSKSAQKFSKIEEIAAQDFIDHVLPTARELEVYVENKHTENFVSLIAPEVKDSKTMFKWDNNFGWSYTGNMTDGMMKERVKAAGGKVDGDLRFSIQWNDIDTGHDNNDLDAHCITANGNEIYFGRKSDAKTCGVLDVDIIDPRKDVAVENITWATRKTMTPGKYKFFVHQFSNRGGRRGFRAEIEFDGQIYSYNYDRELRQSENVNVAEVTLDTNGKFSIKEFLASATSSKEVWGITTNQFVPVTVVSYSPNYWNEQTGIGNKHLFFMLKNCVNPESPNGFFNEFLNEELMKHKRVFEALGSKMHVADAQDQLSGLGFCMTKRNDIIVKVKGNVERVMKVKF